MENSPNTQNHEAPDTSDPYGFADAMKDAPSLEQNLAYDNSPSYHDIDQKLNFTSESIRYYAKDRSQENYDTIMQSNQPFLAQTYKTIIQEYPCIANVKVVDQDVDGNAYYSAATKFTNGQFLPTVKFNFSNTKAYLKPESLQNGDNFGLEYVLKTIALKTGAKPSEIVHNERLVATFIMLHEFGHALDFRTNYLDPALSQLEGPGKGIQALPMAIKKDAEDRLRDLMTQPIPGQVSADGYLEKVAPFTKRLRALGIDPNNPKEVITSMQKAYREMSSEAFADNFATDYIARHYDDFFESSASYNYPSEKVKTHIGELMRISLNIGILGLGAGKSIRLSGIRLQKGQDGQTRILNTSPLKIIKGFLSQNLRIGESIKLLRKGDPTAKEDYSESSIIDSVYIRPKKDRRGNIHNDIILQLGSQHPHYFLVDFTKQAPAKITVSPEEMTDDLKLDVGSKVMLMKRDLSASSAVRLGSILGGKIKQPPYSHNDSPIQMNHGIYLTSTFGEKTGIGNLTDPKFMCGGNTSPIRKIYRQWKSYYIETDTSTYEVIPYI